MDFTFHKKNPKKEKLIYKHPRHRCRGLVIIV